MTIRLLTLWALLFTLPSPALAQDAPGEPLSLEPVATQPAPDALLGEASPEAQQAAQAWSDVWHATPRLVSLQSTDDGSKDMREALQDRLKLLGEKTFSNREWKSYWEQQQLTATALATAMKASAAPSEKIAGIEAWAALASEKVTNQDRFFEAIESERDALEDRLESTLEIKTEADEQALGEPEITDPNPYERRRMALEDLERLIDVQTSKKAMAVSEVTFIERQLASEAILSEALGTDLALARQELAIAEEQAGNSGLWSALWTEIADASRAKVDAIAAEYEYGEARARSRQVELGLAQSQIRFRDGRITDLTTEYEQAGSIGTWIAATGDTILEWLRVKAWKVIIGLFFIYLMVRLALRLNVRLVRIILERTDDNPDLDDDSDQRRETLADVFEGVVRIAIFIIGGLIALEQIGINTGPLLGSVAILGLAISFGSQNLVRDVVNGFFILLENQFAVGDVVTIGGVTGTVERITIRSTWVRAYSGNLNCIPNGSISLVTNSTRGWSGAIVEVGVSYSADLDQVREIINAVGEEIYADPEWTEKLEAAPQWVGVTQLGDSSVVVRAYVKTLPGAQWATQRELYRRFKIAFDKAGIEIPFPQTVVHQVAK